MSRPARARHVQRVRQSDVEKPRFRSHKRFYNSRVRNCWISAGGILKADRKAAPGCVIHAGPAPSIPFTVATIPDVAGLRVFGVRPVDGVMRLTVNAKNADGTTTQGVPTEIPIPVYQVMLGALFAYLQGPLRGLIIGENYARVWPVRAMSVTVETALRTPPQ
jgi:hypothetical protein